MSAKRPLLARQQKVLDRMGPHGMIGTVNFGQFNEDTEEWERRYSMRRSEWADFGSPDQITITIEPGDRLNDSEEDSP